MVVCDPEPKAQRRARGRAARAAAPRRALGDWSRPRGAPPALATLRAQEAIRLPELLPIRYGRMSASPWTYFRGAAAVMAADLATRAHSGLAVQLCGDAHVLNFGLWATPERNLAFDLRDFDETLEGPFEWDLLRLATSLVVLARENGQGDRAAERAVVAMTTAYRDRLRSYVDADQMDVWYDAIHHDELLRYFAKPARRDAERFIERKQRRSTSRGSFAKLTAVLGGRRRIIEDPPFVTHDDDAHRLEVVREVFERYRESLQDDRSACLDRFRFVDVARQVVGVGSVGMRVHLVLLEGPNGDPLFLQVKQAGPSVYEEHLAPSPYDNHGARVVNGKRYIQAATDIFAGWTSVEDVDFYVRQYRDMKIIPNAERLRRILPEFAAACGEVLARAHAKTGDAVALAAYLGKNDDVVDAAVRFGRAYADQNERDHGDLVDAVAAGDVEAAPGW
ncbi:MAG: DUF2252 domain-containing protein [Acidimicrobiales bacterium]